ncbi:MAG TPA: hypothetical protein VH370_04310 [Humisphaera sp.]|jgi:hypothetical protein|nr:hypothetical protein [Humisphaera sp.]
MKFVDPMPIRCPKCAAESSQSEADLLALRAKCPMCGESFADAGQRMRSTYDDFGDFATIAGIQVAIERRLGIKIDDSQWIEKHPTLRQAAQEIHRQVPAERLTDAELLRLVEEAATSLRWCDAKTIDLDARPMDAVDPGRWERR